MNFDWTPSLGCLTLLAWTWKTARRREILDSLYFMFSLLSSYSLDLLQTCLKIKTTNDSSKSTCSKRDVSIKILLVQDQNVGVLDWPVLVAVPVIWGITSSPC